MQNERPSNRSSRQRVRNHPHRRHGHQTFLWKPLPWTTTHTLQGAKGHKERNKRLARHRRVARAYSSDLTCHLGQCHGGSVRHSLTTVHTATRKRVESTLDPLTDNACSDYDSIGAYPNGCVGMLRWGEDIETKWFSGRLATPIRSRRKKSDVWPRAFFFLFKKNKKENHNHRIVDGASW